MIQSASTEGTGNNRKSGDYLRKARYQRDCRHPAQCQNSKGEGPGLPGDYHATVALPKK